MRKSVAFILILKLLLKLPSPVAITHCAFTHLLKIIKEVITTETPNSLVFHEYVQK